MPAFHPHRPISPRSGSNRVAILMGAGLIWATAVLALLAGAEWLCPDRHCRVPEFDRAILLEVAAWRHPVADSFWSAATHLGSLYVLLPAAIAAAALLQRRGQALSGWFVLLSLAGASALAHGAKLFIARPRPDLFSSVIKMPPDFSYPSAHSMQAAAFVLALLLLPHLRSGAVAWLCGIVVVVVVALSRLYLQVHFPTDVLLAIVAAAGWVVGLRLLVHWLPARAQQQGAPT